LQIFSSVEELDKAVSERNFGKHRKGYNEWLDEMRGKARAFNDL